MLLGVEPQERNGLRPARRSQGRGAVVGEVPRDAGGVTQHGVGLRQGRLDQGQIQARMAERRLIVEDDDAAIGELGEGRRLSQEDAARQAGGDAADRFERRRRLARSRNPVARRRRAVAKPPTK